MGLIHAALDAAGGVLADQWKEYFTCDSLPANVIAVRGKKNHSGRFGNNQGSDNVITNGSGIVVADGQCVIITDGGKVAELCAEPGTYTYDQSSEPSIFDGGNLGDNIMAVFASIGKRFTYGGGVAADQRVYYFNTKEMVGNKYGTANPIPIRTVDHRAGIDMDIHIKCFGEYSYRVTNPILFYSNVCGNITDAYTRDQLDGQMRSELLTHLQPAFTEIGRKEIRYSELPGYADDLADILNNLLSDKWRDLRGIEIVSFGVASITATEEDEREMREMQREATYTDPARAAGRMVNAAAASMQDAANNSGDAVNGFMGMNMAANQYGNNIGTLFGMAQQQQQAQPMQTVQPAPQPMQQPAAGSWTCSCGNVNTGNFCSNCGSPNPNRPWVCSCGAQNTGKFCSNCGKPRG